MWPNFRDSVVVDFSPGANNMTCAVESAVAPSKGKIDLEQQYWYHGFRPRHDVVNLLRNPGDFLVRATESQIAPHIVLSSMNDRKEVHHLFLKFDEAANKWFLGVLSSAKAAKRIVKFDSVVALIEYYKHNKGPGRMRLRNGIRRPEWLIKHDKIQFNKETDLVGTGNFCCVYRGKYTTNEPVETLTVAIKTCHEDSLKTNEEAKKERNKMMAEAQLMSYYTHDFVVKLFGVACDRPPVLIVMEFCHGGNLEDFLKKMGDSIEVGELLEYSFEAARGLRYLHSNNCVHRDIAARNCLISSKGTIKIADFGLSRFVSDIETTNTNTSESHEGKSTTVSTEEEASPQIPLRWMAPESLRKPMAFSRASDVWSYGVLLYEGERLWTDETNDKKIATWIRKGAMPSMPAKMPQELAQFVSTQIWVLEPSKRSPMRQMCKAIHGIMKKIPCPPIEQRAINTLEGVKNTIAAAADDDGDRDSIKEVKPNVASSLLVPSARRLTSVRR